MRRRSSSPPLLKFVVGEQRGAEDSRSDSVAGEPDRRSPPHAREGIALGHPLGGREQKISGARGAASDHHLLGIEGVDRVGDPHPDALAPQLDDARSGWIASLSRLYRV